MSNASYTSLIPRLNYHVESPRPTPLEQSGGVVQRLVNNGRHNGLVTSVWMVQTGVHLFTTEQPEMKVGSTTSGTTGFPGIVAPPLVNNANARTGATAGGEPTV